MRKNLFVALTLGALMVPLALQASNPIDQSISLILDNNPDLKSQAALISAQRADDSDANSLENPEVAFSRVWGADGIGNKLQLDLSQSFDWPGLYRMRGRAAAKGISVAQMALASQGLDLAMQAKELLIELVYVRKQIAVQKELIANMDTLDAFVKRSVDAGQLTILDLRKQEIEDYKLKAALGALQSRQTEIETELCAMAPDTQLPLSMVDTYPAEPLRSESEYLGQVDQMDPLYASQMLTIEQENLNAKAATMSRFPSFTLGYQHQAEMGDRFNGFTAAMTLPFFQNRKARSAALSRRQASEQSAELIVGQRETEIKGKLAQLSLWKEQMDMYQSTVANDSYLVLLNKVYQQGQMNSHEFISETQYYLENMLSFLEAEYNYNLALANLNKYDLLR